MSTIAKPDAEGWRAVHLGGVAIGRMRRIDDDSEEMWYWESFHGKSGETRQRSEAASELVRRHREALELEGLPI